MGVAARARARLCVHGHPGGRCLSGGSTQGGEPPADEVGDDPIANRGDRYVAEPPGTVKKMRFWYGPYVDAARAGTRTASTSTCRSTNGMIIVRSSRSCGSDPDWTEPSHQEAHIHHAHWFALDPGNEEDNYTVGNTEWIFGNGDEETRADFCERSRRGPEGPRVRRVHRRSPGRRR